MLNISGKLVACKHVNSHFLPLDHVEQLIGLRPGLLGSKIFLEKEILWIFTGNRPTRVMFVKKIKQP